MPPSTPKVRTSDIYLIVDTRERGVIPFVEDSLGRAPGAVPLNFAHVVGQVNTGDYLICRRGVNGGKPIVLAVIERKTHVDFAASFKDGRYENLNKMLAMRAATGCQLYYFVEGPAFPEPTRRFARIPFANIKAAEVDLQVVHKVFVVLTKDEQHTAASLAEFMYSFDKSITQPKPRAAIPANFAPAEAFAGVEQPQETACEELKGQEDVQEEMPEPEFLPTVPSALTALVAVSDGDTAIAALSCLRGINVVLGKLIIQEFSIADLACKRISASRIAALKTASGRIINKDAISSLTAVAAGLETHCAKVLSGLRNVTLETAKAILKAVGGMQALCAADVTKLQEIKLEQKTRTVRLGKLRAEKILSVLRYCDAERPSPDDAKVGGLPPGKIAPAGNEPTKNAVKAALARATEAKVCKRAKGGKPAGPNMASLDDVYIDPDPTPVPEPTPNPASNLLAEFDEDELLELLGQGGSSLGPSSPGS